MTQERKLGIEEDGEIKPISPVCSGLSRCCRCRVELTVDNDSGWEVFVNPTATAPICKHCWANETPRGCALEKRDG